MLLILLLLVPLVGIFVISTISFKEKNPLLVLSQIKTVALSTSLINLLLSLLLVPLVGTLSEKIAFFAYLEKDIFMYYYHYNVIRILL